MKTKNQPRIVRGRIELWTPHNGGEIAFAPLIGGDEYREVGWRILNSNQRVPTGDYTASLLHTAYGCTPEARRVIDEPEFSEIRYAISESPNAALAVFNINLWIDKGVYVFQDNEVIGASQCLTPEGLEKMLGGGKEIDGIRFSRDNRVRFAPKGSYVLGEQTPEELAKNGFIIASYGKEGAKKLAEISYSDVKYYDNPPYNVLGLDISKGQKPKQRMSAIFDTNSRITFGDTYSEELMNSHNFEWGIREGILDEAGNAGRPCYACGVYY
jgi:hypothetical protein